MANDKKFLVKNGLTTQNISFVDDTQSANNTIVASMLNTDTLSFSGNSGQLFSITDSLSGTIFAVNDISGVPSIEVDDDGTIRLAETFGYVLVGTDTAIDGNKLQVAGNVTANGEFYAQNTQRVFHDNYHPNADILTTARTISLGGVLSGSASFDGSANITITAAHTSDPVITLTGDVTGTGTMTNLGNVSIATTVASNSVALGTDTTGNYVATGAVSGNGLSGSASAEGATFTVTSNATNVNTASTIVFRDASGNFSAGTITAALSGNASTATTLQTARTISLGGVLSGSASFDGSANITITAAHTSDPTLTLAGDATGSATFTNLGNATLTVAVVDDSHNHSSSSGNFTVNGTLTATGNTALGGSLQVDGDLTVSGNTVTVSATNLSIEDNMIYLNQGSTVSNPDLGWAGNYNDGTYAHAGFFRDASDGYFKPFKGYTLEPDASAFIDTAHASFALADIQAANFRGALVGNASTATTLQTARTINGVSFNGSANITVEPYIEDDEGTNATRFVVFTDNSTGGFKRLNEDSAFTYNPSTGVITATRFTGAVTGAVTGNATTATTLQTARTIGLSGVTATATSFNGSANITIPVTAVPATLLTGTIADARISGSYTGMTNLTGTGNVDFAKFLGNAADTVAAPSYSWTGDTDTGMWRPGADQIGFATAGVSRLNITTTAITSTLPITASTFTGALSGNATTASAWQTARTITLGGVLSGSTSIDGSGNVTLTAAHTSDPVITLTGAVTGSGTMTNLGSVSIATTATADPTLTLAGDATGSATFTNLGNATLTVAIVDDSHEHTRLSHRDTITYGASYLQVMDQDGVGGTGLNSAAPTNPTNAWYHNALFNHGNVAGYYTQMSLGINSDDIWYRRLANGSLGSWHRAFTDLYHPNADTLTTARTINGTSFNGSANITTANWGTARNISLGGTSKSVNGSTNYTWTITELGITKTNIDALNINADTVDGIQAASFLRSDANDDFSGTLNYTPDTGTVLSFDGQAILRRLNADGALAIGHDSALIMGGGEAIDAMVANIVADNEVVHIGAEGGVTFYAFPANNTTWSNRKEMVYDQNGNLTVPGQLNAITKSFVIDHPTKPDMKLRYGSLEGPENGVYVRGRLTGSNAIELPDYWTGLVHEDSITVNLTPIGRKHVWIESIDNNTVSVGCDDAVDCFYTIFAERKDVNKLEVEYENES